VPRSSAFRYKNVQIDQGRAVRELNVRTLLTGRILQRGDTLSVQAELVDVSTDSQLWGHKYTRNFAGIVTVDPARSVTHRREDNNRVRFLTMEEEKKLRKTVEAKWASHLPELDVAINTGLRKGSQYSLTWEMVDWKGRMLNIPRTKNEEPIHVPLNDAALTALRVVHALSDGRGRVFQSAKTGEPLENGRHWFDDAVIVAEIKNFRWHDLRHTFASRLRMKGAPLEDIADLLGHKSMTMTRRYAHLGPNKLHAVVSLLGTSDTTTDTNQNGVGATTSQVAVH
jgi:integrase